MNPFHILGQGVGSIGILKHIFPHVYGDHLPPDCRLGSSNFRLAAPATEPPTPLAKRDHRTNQMPIMKIAIPNRREASSVRCGTPKIPT